MLFNAILTGDTDQTATIVDDSTRSASDTRPAAPRLYMLGEPTSTDDFKKISEEDLKKGESIGIVVAIIVLLIVFGSLIAGVTPDHHGRSSRSSSPSVSWA